MKREKIAWCFLLVVGFLCMSIAVHAYDYWVNLEDTTTSGTIMYGGIDPWGTGDEKSAEFCARVHTATATGGSNSGEFPLEFAMRFRILEDRGVRRALLSGAPNVENEYVVVVEVYVDVGRVLERLRSSGAPLAPAGDEPLFRIWLVAEGVDSFAAYDALRRTLAATAGVRAVLPVDLRRGRVEFEIDAERAVFALLDDLLAAAPPDLRIIPLESQEDRVTVLLDWREPESADADEPAEPARGAEPRD